MSKRINDTELRKQQILRSARKVFMEKGFEKATVDDIAKEEGVVRGTILYHYKSKACLVEAVLEEDGRKMELLLDTFLSKHDIPVRERIDRIFALCETYFASARREAEAYTKNRERVRFLTDQMRLKNFYVQTRELTALLEEGVRSGELSLRDPRAQAASTVFAVFGVLGADIGQESFKRELKSIKEKLLTDKR